MNCAGLSSGKEPAASVPVVEFDTLMNVNAHVPLVLTQRYLPSMLAAGFGRIINVNSIWGLRGSANNTAYTMSKHTLTGLTKSVAKDYGGSGVTCNEVSPGAVESRMMDRIVADVRGATRGRTGSLGR